MSKLTDSFREVGVYNSSGFYGNGRVYVAYRPGDSGRFSQSAAWQVIRPGFKTDPEGHWRDYGHRTFSDFAWEGGSLKERRADGLAKAQAWAAARYGIAEWAKDPYGGYGDAEFVRGRIAELRAAVASVVVS